MEQISVSVLSSLMSLAESCLMCGLVAEHRTEISYTVRYPVFKTSENRWVLRQSGIYNRVNTETAQSLYVLVNPEANSKVHTQAQEFLRNYDGDGPVDPFWLHKMLLSTYMPSWRQYIAWLERKLLPTVNQLFFPIPQPTLTLVATGKYRIRDVYQGAFRFRLRQPDLPGSCSKSLAASPNDLELGRGYPYRTGQTSGEFVRPRGCYRSEEPPASLCNILSNSRASSRASTGNVPAPGRHVIVPRPGCL